MCLLLIQRYYIGDSCFPVDPIPACSNMLHLKVEHTSVAMSLPQEMTRNKTSSWCCRLAGVVVYIQAKTFGKPCNPYPARAGLVSNSKSSRNTTTRLSKYLYKKDKTHLRQLFHKMTIESNPVCPFQIEDKVQQTSSSIRNHHAASCQETLYTAKVNESDEESSR